jgi:hypothetical protein
MRSLKHYLMESTRTYRYTIKIAGDLDKNFLELFKYNLQKFDPLKIEDAKTTPVQKSPYDFPELENETVTIIRAEFKYPATEPMIQQVAQHCGHNINKVRVFTTDFSDSINSEEDKFANADKSEALLLKTELEDSGKEASQEYANQYLDKVVPKQPSIDIPYAGQKTPTAPNKSKEGINTKGPFSSVKRPERPATGARK